MPETANGFETTVGVLLYLDGRKGVFSQIFAGGGSMRGIVDENVKKRMAGAKIGEETETLSIHVLAVMQLRSKRRGQGHKKDRLRT